MFRSYNKEATELARQTFLQVDGWQQDMAERLANLAAYKTVEQTFGADFDRRRLRSQLSAEKLKAVKKLGDLVPVRSRQQDLFYLLQSLQTPEAVALVAPYLFDDAKPEAIPGERTLQISDAVTFVIPTLYALVPDVPRPHFMGEPREDHLRRLRQWWLANAHRYGADPNFRPAPLASSTAYADTPPPTVVSPPATPGPAIPATPSPVKQDGATARRPAVFATTLAALAALLLGIGLWKRRR